MTENTRKIDPPLILIIRKIEVKFRFLLMCFCLFTALDSLKTMIGENLFTSLREDSIIATAIMIVFSVASALFFKLDLKEIFVEGWEWEADNTVEKIQNEFICLVGVLTLYTWTQIGIILYFFPAIQSEMIFGLRLLIVMPIVNSLIIYIGYRLTILKW
ncbi:hypothetical protein [Priestia aryabhattai]